MEPGIWNLEFGAWSLVLQKIGIWNLVLGI
jgi:hypothetical protein